MTIYGKSLKIKNQKNLNRISLVIYSVIRYYAVFLWYYTVLYGISIALYGIIGMN